MHIMDAQRIIVATHSAAIARNERASSLHLIGTPGCGKSEGVAQSCEWLCRILNEPVAFAIHTIANWQSIDSIGFMLPVAGSNGEVETRFSLPPWMPTSTTVFVVVPAGWQPPDDTGHPVRPAQTLVQSVNQLGYSPASPLAGSSAATANASSNAPRWYPPGTWKWELPRYGVIFFDEWGQAERDVKKSLSTVKLDGRQGTRALPLGYRCLSASNRMGDRSGVEQEMMHMINRECRMMVAPHAPSWRIWATNQPSFTRPHHTTISFAMTHTTIVFAEAVPDTYESFCTSRSLVRADRDVRALRSQEEIDNDLMPTSALAREFFEGWIGKNATGQLFQHYKYHEENPTIEDICRSPGTAKLSPKRDAQMVAAYMIAHHATPETAEAVFAYMKRLNVEMQMVCANAIRFNSDRIEAMRIVPGFGQWCMDNQAELIASFTG